MILKWAPTYRVTLRKGLRAIDGSTLPRDFYSSVTFRKERIPPQIDFVGEGFYLTRQGNLNLGLSTINVDKVILEVEKIFANNLTYLLNVQNLSGSQRYYGYYPLRALGKRIHQSEMVIQMVENQEVVTPIPVKEFLADERIGIFKFTARQKEQRWNMASKWVVATDLGILAKEAGEDLWVWVNSLSKLQPVQNAEVKLISQNNQTLMTATTDAEGLAIFRNYKQFTDEFVPYLITVALGQDLSFLELQRRRVPTSDFDVGGAPYLQQGYQAFVYNERDIYRPGETAHLAAIVRGENLGVPVPFPVILRVRSPDGKILTEQKGKLNDQGGVEFSVPIPDYAMTGRYFCILLIGEDEEIGRTFFNVEEFIPDRMKVTLTTSQAAYFPGDTMQITVEAVTLFGPPAAGRRVEAELDITPQFFSSPSWRSFRFYDEKKSFSPMHEFLGENRLDESGKFTYTYKIPENLKPPSALLAKISATVTEPGGRGVTDMAQVTIHPYSHYVGLRKAKEGYATPSEETWFEYVTVNPQGQPVADRNLEVEFYRVYWHSILKRMGKRGRYRYVSEKVEELIQKFNVVSQAGIGRFSVTPDQYGKYLVVVRDVESGASSSISFYASGWGYAPWAMDHPDRLELDLDKSEYQVGETARVQVRAPFSGKLFLTLEREKIFEHRVLNLEGNTATLEIPVLESYKPNVYVSAHLIRSTESLERDTPARAFGVTPLMVNSHANRLNVTLDVPDEIRPNSTLKVKFQVKGQKQGRPYVTVAAVDEGICQLTDFQSPDPHAFFFSKKRLEVASFDIYGMILPEIESSLSSAAGGITEARRRHLIPVSVARVKPVAFWSGLLKTDRRGRGQVSFDIPQFNGTLRIMAVAFVGDQFGSATKNLFVREPLVLTPTLPRFISSTDLFQVPVNIYNGTGKEANIEVRLKIDGPATIQGSDRQSIKIPKDKERLVTFTVKAEETTGKVTFHFTTQGGGAQTKMQVEVPLRPPVPFTTLSGNGVVEEGKPATFALPGDWLSGTTDFTLTVSSFPAVQFAGSLQYLLRYPYGCIEQTTSRVFPLLYFDELARVAEPELFKNNSADYYIQEGIARLESMQLISGAFTYWPVGGYINTWSSVYASHFLVEARRAGYVVSDRVYNRLLDALHNYTRSYRFEDPYSYQTAVYACYVLALAGKPDRSTMLYFKNNVLDRLPPFSRYQLAGAFALAGDLQTARSLLPRMASPPKLDVKRETGRNFNSSVRAKAIMLDVL
ncbi:MAG: alpha-2-macroglobulin family protein, partial [Calditrichaeota bacterium]